MVLSCNVLFMGKNKHNRSYSFVGYTYKVYFYELGNMCFNAVFSQFDGNNILFLVWIADILLFFYDIEIKEGKLLKHKIEKAAKQINDESVALTLEQRAEKIDSMLSEMSAKMNGGEEK